MTLVHDNDNSDDVAIADDRTHQKQKKRSEGERDDTVSTISKSDQRVNQKDGSSNDSSNGDGQEHKDERSSFDKQIDAIKVDTALEKSLQNELAEALTKLKEKDLNYAGVLERNKDPFVFFRNFIIPIPIVEFFYGLFYHGSVKRLEAAAKVYKKYQSVVAAQIESTAKEKRYGADTYISRKLREQKEFAFLTEPLNDITAFANNRSEHLWSSHLGSIFGNQETDALSQTATQLKDRLVTGSREIGKSVLRQTFSDIQQKMHIAQTAAKAAGS